VADLTLRTVKGSNLTFAEIDRNFTSLDSDVKSVSGSHWDSDDTTLLVDSDYIQSRQAFSAFDSDEVVSIIDSDYIQSRQAFSAFDSGEVTSIIDSDYIESHLDGIDASDGGNDF
jgi:hypothetical protein